MTYFTGLLWSVRKEKTMSPREIRAKVLALERESTDMRRRHKREIADLARQHHNEWEAFDERLERLWAQGIRSDSVLPSSVRHDDQPH